ncbi:MAG: hypothetical protein ACLSAP_10520 [Oscillospiraceae bacterium]
MLADFAALAKDTVCDLGTGCGIIDDLAAEAARCWSVDIQPQARQFALSIERCGLGGRLKAVLADLCQQRRSALWGVRPRHLQPAYQRPRRTLSALPADKVARHETLCTIGTLPGGRQPAASAAGSASASGPNALRTLSRRCARQT